MRILFDQGTPDPLRRFLAGHAVSTAFEMGWSTLVNGELLAMAEAKPYQIRQFLDLIERHNLSLEEEA